jgi:hypothetical protein
MLELFGFIKAHVINKVWQINREMYLPIVGYVESEVAIRRQL